MKLAIFQQTDSEKISVLIPAPNCELSLEEICRKDVPTGIKYKIIDSSELPDNRDFRNAWQFDFSNNFDGVGE
tara:strand:+ start:404 stop:622 length:219 start_codon:yes stop_codon:yes gene_type:complete